jgi:hypothetical protein
LVLTSNRNEYNEIKATTTIVIAENRIPPLKKLICDIDVISTI